jgi:hypothetical protein
MKPLNYVRNNWIAPDVQREVTSRATAEIARAKLEFGQFDEPRFRLNCSQTSFPRWMEKR